MHAGKAASKREDQDLPPPPSWVPAKFHDVGGPPCKGQLLSRARAAEASSTTRDDGYASRQDAEACTVRIESTPMRLSWRPAVASIAYCLELAAVHKKIPYEEVLAAWATPITQLCGCLGEQEWELVVAALHRRPSAPSTWQLREHRLVTRSQEQAREWVARIESQLQLCWDRPRNLLVFINPFSGARKARAVWEQQAMPVFVKARIRFTAIETLHANHAYETIAGMTADELAQYQGIVAVGGDGVFQECLMGVIEQKGRKGEGAGVAARLRVGHIPGGSTDAVAYTLHGTRCPVSAALHIALGDRQALDVGRVDCHPPPPSTSISPSTTTAKEPGQPGTRTAHPLIKVAPWRAQPLQPRAGHSSHQKAGVGSCHPEPCPGQEGVGHRSSAEWDLGGWGSEGQEGQAMLGASGAASSAAMCSSSDPCHTGQGLAGSKGRSAQDGVVHQGGGLGGGGLLAAAAARQLLPGHQPWSSHTSDPSQLQCKGQAPAQAHPSPRRPGQLQLRKISNGSDPGFKSSTPQSQRSQGQQPQCQQSQLQAQQLAVQPAGQLPRDAGHMPGPAPGAGAGSGGVGLPAAALLGRHFVCQAAYGFLGDVMRLSEGLRFLGPARYDIAGALQFLRLRPYRLHIAYRPCLDLLSPAPSSELHTGLGLLASASSSALRLAADSPFARRSSPPLAQTSAASPLTQASATPQPLSQLPAHPQPPARAPLLLQLGEGMLPPPPSPSRGPSSGPASTGTPSPLPTSSPSHPAPPAAAAATRLGPPPSGPGPSSPHGSSRQQQGSSTPLPVAPAAAPPSPGLVLRSGSGVLAGHAVDMQAAPVRVPSFKASQAAGLRGTGSARGKGGDGRQAGGQPAARSTLGMAGAPHSSNAPSTTPALAQVPHLHPGSEAAAAVQDACPAQPEVGKALGDRGWGHGSWGSWPALQEQQEPSPPPYSQLPHPDQGRPPRHQPPDATQGPGSAQQAPPPHPGPGSGGVGGAGPPAATATAQCGAVGRASSGVGGRGGGRGGAGVLEAGVGGLGAAGGESPASTLTPSTSGEVSAAAVRWVEPELGRGLGNGPQQLQPHDQQQQQGLPLPPCPQGQALPSPVSCQQPPPPRPKRTHHAAPATASQREQVQELGQQQQQQRHCQGQSQGQQGALQQEQGQQQGEQQGQQQGPQQGPDQAMLDESWVVEEGEWVSVMVLVTPCRSDKTKAGILPYAHLNDGRLYLVLVGQCSRLEYLHFLLRLSGQGLVDGCLPFVRVIPITAAQARPVGEGPHSCWNVDGELLPHNACELKVQRGHVDVFARGVELSCPRF
ncbi:hypothetical protein QJQ45_018391 [Haematococcus lacustris]|nr:hypothetical protein QJQ45_018391 [Haematococcus lacustris]